jgi:hypothetical protein
LWELLVGEIFFSWMKFSWQIADAIVAGQLPNVPTDSTFQKYSEIITKTWKLNPEERTTFNHIFMELSEMNCDEM